MLEAGNKKNLDPNGYAPEYMHMLRLTVRSIFIFQGRLVCRLILPSYLSTNIHFLPSR